MNICALVLLMIYDAGGSAGSPWGLLEHNSGKVQSTMSRRPFELRYYEVYSVESDARKREAALKKDGRAVAQLRGRIGESLR